MGIWAWPVMRMALMRASQMRAWRSNAELDGRLKEDLALAMMGRDARFGGGDRERDELALFGSKDLMPRTLLFGGDLMLS
jgi:hypothetical protein